MTASPDPRRSARLRSHRRPARPSPAPPGAAPRRRAPARFSLYGDSYVAESDASASTGTQPDPPQPPPAPRAAAARAAAARAAPPSAGAAGAGGGDAWLTPPAAAAGRGSRRESLLEAVRASLVDLLGSAARARTPAAPTGANADADLGDGGGGGGDDDDDDDDDNDNDNDDDNDEDGDDDDDDDDVVASDSEADASPPPARDASRPAHPEFLLADAYADPPPFDLNFASTLSAATALAAEAGAVVATRATAVAAAAAPRTRRGAPLAVALVLVLCALLLVRGMAARYGDDVGDGAHARARAAVRHVAGLSAALPAVPEIRLPAFALPALPVIVLPSLSWPVIVLPAMPAMPAMPALPSIPDISPVVAALNPVPAVRVRSAAAAAAAADAAAAAASAARSALLLVPALFARPPAPPRPLATDYPPDLARFMEMYAADKGAPPDFALASVGARVVASTPSAARLYVRYLANYVLALAPTRAVAYAPTVPNRPHVALTPDITPGNCWAFPGSAGSITVRLARPIRPDRITLEHTPKSSVFSVSSAPRRVIVYALPLVSLPAPDAPGERAAFVKVGAFTYDTSPGASHLQTFALDARATPPVVSSVRFDILSNHGSPTHTCLYRVRVHGEPVSATERDALTQQRVL